LVVCFLGAKAVVIANALALANELGDRVSDGSRLVVQTCDNEARCLAVVRERHFGRGVLAYSQGFRARDPFAAQLHASTMKEPRSAARFGYDTLEVAANACCRRVDFDHQVVLEPSLSSPEPNPPPHLDLFILEDACPYAQVGLPVRGVTVGREPLRALRER